MADDAVDAKRHGATGCDVVGVAVDAKRHAGAGCDVVGDAGAYAEAARRLGAPAASHHLLGRTQPAQVRADGVLMIIHLVARSLPGQKPFADARAAWWLMGRLRVAYTGALAACVMPDHLHLIVEVPDPASARRRLSKILAVAAVRAGVRHLFERVAEPQALPPGKHLERSVRYLHLNPCRAGLVADPLAWPWSTHRGLVGAEVDPWVTPASLASALGRPVRGLSEWLHRYVSSDPSVEIGGTATPTPASSAELPSTTLEAIRAAVLAATPWSTPSARRSEVVRLAAHQGWSDSRLIARVSGLSLRSAQRLAVDRREPSLPVRVCLGDVRLSLASARVRPLMPQWRWSAPRSDPSAMKPRRAA